MERRLRAILSADVKDYSRLMGEDEVETIRTLIDHRELITTIIQQYGGRVVDSPGDNLLADFSSAVSAVKAALDIQSEIRVRNEQLQLHRQMQHRIGINVGEIIEKDARIYGDAVNITARLENLATAGSIAISGTVYDQIQNKLHLNYKYFGEQKVKNIASSIRMYGISELGTSLNKDIIKQPTYLTLPDKPSIAVLPFVNLCNDIEQEHFSDGITDDLITDLSKISGLFVIARNSTFAYKGKSINIGEISRELGVQYVLEGSVRKIGNQLRINVQLVDGPKGGHLWADRYDREWQDVFKVQDDITSKVVFALKIRLSAEEKARFKLTPTENLDAYEHFLKAEALFWKYRKDTNAEARMLLSKVIELDPDYAAAFALKARTYTSEWSMHWTPDRTVLDRAFELARKAVDLDKNLPWAHATLGFVYGWKKQHEKAIIAGEKAVSVDPNFADGLASLGYTFIQVGRYQESIDLIERAIRLNPHFPFLYEFYLGCAYYGSKLTTMAVESFNKIIDTNPDFTPAHAFMAACYAELGQKAKANAEIMEVLRINPDISLNAVRQLLPYEDAEPLLSALQMAGLK